MAGQQDTIQIRRALVSVFDKTGLDELVTGLHAAGVELVSTGGSAALIESLGLPVTKVEDLTGFPECLDGRVKTLHPRVHAGILADRRLASHEAQLAELGVEPFDLVVVNLYPFAATVAAGGTPEEIIEKIDIGGPSMVRAAAKNHPSVAIVTDGADYAKAVEAAQGDGFSYQERKALAAKAFVHTATYDVHVASWMGSVLTDSAEGTGFPAWIGATWDKQSVLRYGENPHQRAALYANGSGVTGLAQAEQLHGKEMSYNNYVDTDAARRAANDFTEPAVAIIKHANPCGIAVGADIAEAHRKANACDPVSAFGGVIAANRTVTKTMAEQLRETFTEAIVAPAYDDDALEVLRTLPRGGKNIRILVAPVTVGAAVETRAISGGLLVQEVDHVDAEGDDVSTWTLATGEAADEQTLADLAFAWKACRAAKSNAILLAKDGGAVGIGMGQVNRVDSCRLAVERANTLAGDEARAEGAVAASDAFFPFEDGPQILIDARVKAIVQPGGSVRDELTIEACKKAGVTMYFTGTRHFFH
ncbi:bifunctional phosphoribosylaminoimidazolecarboxamide formyltransferase/IMP cyclohydrolase [Nocardioides sp. BP30]|uniref:bifunctional phosphoribosylaminoimidazolecarboxamide formyltransferase/IMP cyclohydrolase n=1 Tax=Nocardioides sp. BP30 TaxID=3036374 RepID=UPI0024683512|nr:bifunctional phosphoribosylaminoimidazolecarboxamide formyltransferase/IMP cyclohydrolase [Nocardioides sp. BP30]WGL51737.1 bifunctional phosphoribosylaminoimidazolecarboxamide formyltransferase/IMP cyclohydrolase [Nocardioides sp. BP30]